MYIFTQHDAALEFGLGSRTVPHARRKHGTPVLSWIDDPLLTPARIQRAVAKHFNLPRSLIDGATRSRSRRHAYPRMIAMWLCRQLLDMNCTEISHAFGRDRTTAEHAIDTVNLWVAQDTCEGAKAYAIKHRLEAGA